MTSSESQPRTAAGRILLQEHSSGTPHMARHILAIEAEAAAGPPASARPRRPEDKCGNCGDTSDDHSQRGAELCGIPWCTCPGWRVARLNDAGRLLPSEAVSVEAEGLDVEAVRLLRDIVETFRWDVDGHRVKYPIIPAGGGKRNQAALEAAREYLRLLEQREAK